MVITRFAPSPTGFLHVGSARTALFNWLYARHSGGRFILRIEDTDLERSKKEFEAEIIESLQWLGLDWDGPLYHQMERMPVYKKYADLLLSKGLAYAEGQALRFKSPKEKISWNDVVRGLIEFDGTLLDDLVIMKSDGTPTYNFACVCDDGEMGVTDVIRGEDHISNTPKQIPLYTALGFPMPKFSHIPLILGEDRSRLSKRHGATSIRDFRAAGYLPEAMVNYLSLLGWSPGNNQEIVSLKELIEKFTIEKVLSTGAIFSIQKMDWMNGEYIRMMDPVVRVTLFRETMKSAAPNASKSDEWWNRFAELYKERVFRIADLAKDADFFFTETLTWDEESIKVFEKCPNAADVFKKYAQALESLTDFGHDSVEAASRALMKDLGLSGKQFIHPARVAVTGRQVSPGFFETVSLLGKETAVSRLRQAAKRLQTPVS